MAAGLNLSDLYQDYTNNKQEDEIDSLRERVARLELKVEELEKKVENNNSCTTKKRLMIIEDLTDEEIEKILSFIKGV